jgi:DNA-binding PadR family transcriptional regulator
LKKNGYVKTKKMDRPVERTGRPRVYYTLTPQGLQKLAAIQKINKSLWQGMPDLDEPIKK